MKSDTATPFCKLCFHPLEPCSFHRVFRRNCSVCYRCFSKFSPRWFRFKMEGVSCLAIYPYNETIRNALYQFKGCGDIELAPVFLERILFFLKLKYRHYVIVPVPSSPSHDEERGFNQVVEMFRNLNLPMQFPITKPFEMKQSDLNAKQRARIGDFLRFDETKKITNKPVLLVDDVCTTGSTLKACIRLLKQHGVKKIQVLVMSKVIQRGKGDGL